MQGESVRKDGRGVDKDKGGSVRNGGRGVEKDKKDDGRRMPGTGG